MNAFTPNFHNSEAIATCADCGHTERAGNCGPINDPQQRLTAGDPLPAGECTECGSLSYVKPRPQRKRYAGTQFEAGTKS